MEDLGMVVVKVMVVVVIWWWWWWFDGVLVESCFGTGTRYLDVTPRLDISENDCINYKYDIPDSETDYHTSLRTSYTVHYTEDATAASFGWVHLNSPSHTSFFFTGNVGINSNIHSLEWFILTATRFQSEQRIKKSRVYKSELFRSYRSIATTTLWWCQVKHHHDYELLGHYYWW